MALEPIEDAARVAVVIPAYRAAAEVAAVVRGVPALARRVVVVDDGSQDGTAEAVRPLLDERVRLVRHARNLGVGAAMLTGYALALRLGADVVVKLDADGQMDPAHLARLAATVARGEADYAKGNRFLGAFPPPRMPLARLLGNLALTLLTKLASGYWSSFDPTNGYTAIHARVLDRLDPAAIARDYFFETSMLFELRRVGAAVRDVGVPARYAGEPSSLSVARALASFPLRLVAGFGRRVARQYLLFDFTAVSVLLVTGLPLLLAGVAWGVAQWAIAARAGRFASTGTVLLAALPILLGANALLQALILDVQSVPAAAIHPRLAGEPGGGALEAHLARLEAAGLATVERAAREEPAARAAPAPAARA